MSFIHLKVVLDDAVVQKAMQPGDKMCPVLSRYGIEQLPMQKEQSLAMFTVVCVGELCGMYRKCYNLPPEKTP